MRALLIYPRFPSTFWSYEEVLRLVGRKALLPPLGLVTVAALLPPEWELRLVDRNVRDVREEEWEWAEIVLLSAMIVQAEDLVALVGEARRRGKRVVAGGPFPTSVPSAALDAGADCVVAGEAETALAPFLEALRSGTARGVFRGEGPRPDLASSLVPRYDLLDLSAYDSMAVQFSRGCPFDCEFCDITELYGHRVRPKRPERFLAELEALHALGWRRGVFVVDDNFVGNRRAASKLLAELARWQAGHGHPFHFDTQVTIDVAGEAELLDRMVACHFGAVFIGIETPDRASLEQVGKTPNLRVSIPAAVETITAAGLRVMGGFLIGIDGEEAGAGARVVDLMERCAIPTAMLNLLHALPGTALWRRLEQEGRLRSGLGELGNQTALPNFEPTRPMAELVDEYCTAYDVLYEPRRYLDRAYRCFLRLGAGREEAPPPRSGPRMTVNRVEWATVRALLLVVWRQGIARPTRWAFWHHLLALLVSNRRVVSHYLSVCAHLEHFMPYREVVRDRLRAELDRYAGGAGVTGRSSPSLSGR